jgi:hypothetical protein
MSTVDAVVVRLQRPPPVTNSFLPGDGIASNNTTSHPAVAALSAAINPAAPPPATATLLPLIFTPLKKEAAVSRCLFYKYYSTERLISWRHAP